MTKSSGGGGGDFCITPTLRSLSKIRRNCEIHVVIITMWDIFRD